MSAPLLTPDQVLSALDSAQSLVDRYAPISVAPAARAALLSLRSPEAVDAIGLLGAVGLTRAYAWWEAVSPFGVIPQPLSDGDAALDRLRDRGVERVDRRDAEIVAFSAVTSALLEVGWVATRAALPWVIAALTNALMED